MIQGHFEGQKVNLKVKITKKRFLANLQIFIHMTTGVIRHFYVILTVEYVFGDSMSFSRSKA